MLSCRILQLYGTLPSQEVQGNHNPISSKMPLIAPWGMNFRSHKASQKGELSTLAWICASQEQAVQMSWFSMQQYQPLCW